RPDPAERIAGDDRIADAQRAALHENGRDRAPTAVEVSLDRHTFGRALRVGPQVQRRVGGQYDGFEQLGQAGTDHRGDVDEDRVAAVLLRDQAVLGQLAANLRRVGTFLVDLVDGDDDRYAARLRVVERLEGLRHH